ncbi:MAG TPA: NAD(P)-dependent oxidoreductase [Acidimicrobiales bacterium]|nr:NAD(P)-dependent oxidoreductase [Acidimicrobiales bacterium]
MTAVPKVFVCQPVPQPAIDRLKEYAEVEVFPFTHRAITIAELESAARRSDYIYCMHETPVTKSIVGANPNLKGFGLLRPEPAIVDVAACEAAGIPLLASKPRQQPPADAGGRDYPWADYALNPRATSDLLVTLVLNLAYRVAEADRACHGGNGYFQEQAMEFMGLGCTGKTVSLWGLGKVARHAVRKLRALDMNVLYTKRTRLDKEEEEEMGLEWVEEPDDLISAADYLCMLVNYTPENHEIMGEREFKLMKPTAYFVNVGRGRLVDEKAMIKALQDGTIAGAGLDVFWNEPSAYYDPIEFNPYIPLELRKMDNVVLTPHNGGATYDGRTGGTVGVSEAIIADIIARGGASITR